MRKKKRILILNIIIIIIFIVAIILIYNGNISDMVKNTGEIKTSVDGQVNDIQDDKIEEENIMEQQSEAQTETESIMFEDEDGTGSDLVPGYFGHRDSTASGSTSSSAFPDSQNTVEQKKETITFPYSVPNSNLVVQKITSYDGIFLEDGSDSEITGVTAIVLQNTGVTAIEYAKIALKNDEYTMMFEASDIDAGAAVVVQEMSQTLYQQNTYTECVADVAEINELDKSVDEIDVKENADGSLRVSNLTGEVIPCVRLFYKFYMEEENTYVGGITYTARLIDLEAGSSQTITPSHYLAGYSKVVMVRTYDTKE